MEGGLLKSGLLKRGLIEKGTKKRLYSKWHDSLCQMPSMKTTPEMQPLSVLLYNFLGAFH